MSKQPRSGLGTVQRDWSTNTQRSQEELDSDVIPWSPSPPRPSHRTGREERLRAIREALEDQVASSEKVLNEPAPSSSSQTSSSTTSYKRRAESSFSQPPQKKRQLPESWRKMPSQPSALNSVASLGTSRFFGSSNKLEPVPSAVGPSVTKAVTRPAGIFLSPEQTHILKLVQEGKSVFYTGSAGTGKSVLLREIIKALRRTFVKAPDAVAVTASTGIAACNIGGVTIHSFAGIGLGREPPEKLAEKIKKNKKASTRWQRTKVLIIDEVSMVDGDLFDKLARVGSIIRKHHEPFGGIQVIVTGDFFQLPPVPNNNAPVKFAFEAAFWHETINKTFNLTQVFRQTDQEFVNMLNEMRFGRLTTQSINKFKSLSREVIYDDGIGATELFPRREEVERSNQRQIGDLKGKSYTYTSTDGGSITDMQQREKMLGNFMAPRTLSLKLDSQVMLIKNIDETLVNGSMGKVVDFVDPATYAMGAAGPGYEITSNIGVGAAAKKGGKEPPKRPGELYPVVEFLQPGGAKRKVLMTPEVWKVELPSGEVQVSRTQIPLILAWAMSIHKSQGQTLERVKVDLAKVFEKGQAYVALSRATSLEGLQILNFNPSKVIAHPKVATWSRTLETVLGT